MERAPGTGFSLRALIFGRRSSERTEVKPGEARKSVGSADEDFKPRNKNLLPRASIATSTVRTHVDRASSDEEEMEKKKGNEIAPRASAPASTHEKEHRLHTIERRPTIDERGHIIIHDTENPYLDVRVQSVADILKDVAPALHLNHKHTPVARKKEEKIPENSIPYTVQDGDMLAGVAVRFGVPVPMLVKWNKRLTTTIFPGEVIYIPNEEAIEKMKQQQQTRTQARTPKGLAPNQHLDAFKRVSSSHADLGVAADPGGHSPMAIPQDYKRRASFSANALKMKLQESRQTEKLPAVLWLELSNTCVPGLITVLPSGLVFEPIEAAQNDHRLVLAATTITTVGVEHAPVQVPTPPATLQSVDDLPHVHAGHMDDGSNTCLRVCVRPPGSNFTAAYLFNLHPDNTDYVLGRITQATEASHECGELEVPGESLRDAPSGHALDISDAAKHWNDESLFADINPVMMGPQNLINEKEFNLLRRQLPLGQQDKDWVLLFSTDSCGFSLSTLYRRVKDAGPCVLVCRDASQHVFGAYLSQEPKLSEGPSRFYGSGECFLFTLRPNQRAYPWSTKNEYFILGTNQCLAIGVAKGAYGLWLDQDLYHGASSRVETFDNDPLADKESFLCMEVQVWGFA